MNMLVLAVSLLHIILNSPLSLLFKKKPGVQEHTYIYFV